MELKKVIALSIGLGCVTGAVLTLQGLPLWQKAGIILLLGGLMIDAFHQANRARATHGRRRLLHR
jgi:hypothetical protein